MVALVGVLGQADVVGLESGRLESGLWTQDRLASKEMEKLERPLTHVFKIPIHISCIARTQQLLNRKNSRKEPYGPAFVMACMPPAGISTFCIQLV
eukprot:scaffold263112_cov39-Prasinocladus_malaysianus.AAC.1